MRMIKKKEVKVSAVVETIGQAKELLADLEVLNKNYEVSIVVSIFPRVKIL